MNPPSLLDFNFQAFDQSKVLQKHFCIPRFYDSHIHLEGLGRYSGQNDLAQNPGISLTQKLQDLIGFRLKNLTSASTSKKLCYIEAFALPPLSEADLLLFITEALKSCQKQTPNFEFKLVFSDGHRALFFGDQTSALIQKHLTKLNTYSDAQVISLPSSLGYALSAGDQSRSYFEKQASFLKHLEEQSLSQNLLHGQHELLKKGFTHCRDMTSSPTQFKKLLELEKQGKFFIYTDLYFSNFSGESINDLLQQFETCKKLSDRRLQLKGLKVFLDGSLEGKNLDCSCASLSPSPFYYSVSELQELLQLAQSRDFELAFHCIGDLAFEKVIAAFSKLNPSLPLPKVHLEHCEFVNKKSLKLLEQMSPAQKSFLNFHFQPSHWLTDHLRVPLEAQILNFFAWEKLEKAGATQVFFGSDAPVMPPDAFLLLAPKMRPFLSKKKWRQAWWQYFSHPDFHRAPHTFTQFSLLPQNSGDEIRPQTTPMVELTRTPKVFIDGKLIKY